MGLSLLWFLIIIAERRKNGNRFLAKEGGGMADYFELPTTLWSSERGLFACLGFAKIGIDKTAPINI
jgi:hypothetical protein